MYGDTTAADLDPVDYVQLTAEIVCAYVSRNPVPVAELPQLLFNVHSAVAGLGNSAAAAADPERDMPTAAQIRKSIKPDGLVSFIDGKSYKTLKRHLTKHGLTPDGYRQRYGLPRDYPIVAASYSETRSSLAKSLGLGRPDRSAAAE